MSSVPNETPDLDSEKAQHKDRLSKDPAPTGAFDPGKPPAPTDEMKKAKDKFDKSPKD